MVPPAQHIDQAGGGSGLPCACGHDEQMLSHAAADLLAHGADGRLLIIAVGDGVTDSDALKWEPGRPPLDDPFQIGLAEYAAHLALGAAFVIPEKGIEAVGREHDGTLPETELKTVGIEPGLRSSGIGVLAGFFGFHHGKGLAVPAPEHIVRVSLLAGNSGHAFHFVFLGNVAVRPFQFPVHAQEHGVDVDFPGAELGKVFHGYGTALTVAFLRTGVLVRKFGKLLPEPFDLRVFFSQQTFLCPDLLHVEGDVRFGDPLFIERTGLIVAAIGIINPLNELKKTFQRLDGKSGRDDLAGMNGHVPERHDPLDLAEQKGRELLFEGVFVDERGEIVLIGSLYAVIDGIDPLHGQLQSLAAADDAHGGRRGKDLFRLHGGSGEQGELLAAVQKVEVGHTRTPFRLKKEYLTILLDFTSLGSLFFTGISQ